MRPAAIFLCAVLVLALTVQARDAAADVETVTVAPTAADLAAGQGTTLQVTWTVDSEGTMSPPNDREVFSDRVEFFVGKTRVGTVERRLSAGTTGAGSRILTFAETIQVPRSVSIQAAKSGEQAFLIRRFADTQNSEQETGFVLLRLQGAGSGPLSVSRLDLRFKTPKSARYATIVQGTELRALARLTYAGSGILRGRWVIAEPSSTAGQAVFRTLEVVQRPLGASGQEELLGPPLPSNQQGLYELRFEVESPLVDDIPRIVYNVTQGKPKTDGAKLSALFLQEPATGAVVEENTRFSWKAVPGAAAYKVVFYQAGEKPDAGRQPVAGFFLSGERTRSSVPEQSLQRLEHGRRYLFEVIAWNSEGSMIARSNVREVRRQ